MRWFVYFTDWNIYRDVFGYINFRKNVESGNRFPTDHLHQHTLWEEFLGSPVWKPLTRFTDRALHTPVPFKVLDHFLHPTPVWICTNRNVPELTSFQSWGREKHLARPQALVFHIEIFFGLSLFNFLFPVILPGKCVCLSSSLGLVTRLKNNSDSSRNKTNLQGSQIVLRYYRTEITMCAFSEGYSI